MARREELRVDGQSEPISHYTDAVRFGDVLFVSRIAPFDEAGNVVGGDDVVEQTRQVLENIAGILAAAGATLPTRRRRSDADQPAPSGVLR